MFRSPAILAICALGLLAFLVSWPSSRTGSGEPFVGSDRASPAQERPRGSQEQDRPKISREGEDESVKLPFDVKQGHRFTFRALPEPHVARAAASDAADAAKSSAAEKGARGDAVSETATEGARDYRILVSEVARDGNLTLLVAVANSSAVKRDPAEDAAKRRAREGDPGERETDGGGAEDKAGDRTVSGDRLFTLTLGPDGRIEEEPRRDRSVEKGLESHLRLIFGSGLHTTDLRVGDVYTLASLCEHNDSETAGSAGSAEARRDRDAEPDRSEPMRVRYEGKQRVGGEEVARFSVVVRDDAGPAPSSGRDDDEGESAESDEPRTRGTTVPRPGQTDKAVDRIEWTAVGELTYRVADGFLEKAELRKEKVSARAITPAGGTSIVRVQSSP